MTNKIVPYSAIFEINDPSFNPRLIMRTQEYWDAAYKQLMDHPQIEKEILNNIEKRYGKMICSHCDKDVFRISGMYDFKIAQDDIENTTLGDEFPVTLNQEGDIRKYCFSCKGCGTLRYYWSDLTRNENVAIDK